MNTQTIKTASLLKIIGIAVVISGFLAPVAFAALTSTSQSDYEVLAPLPCIPSESKQVGTDASGQPVMSAAVTCQGGNGAVAPKVSFKTYVQYSFNLLIALAAVAAVFMIVWGGFEYITANAPGAKNDGRNRIQNAIYGLVLVLCSFIILRTVDPRFVQISDTLVPKLELTCPGQPGLKYSDPNCLASQSTAIDMLAQLQKEAEQFNITSEQAITSARETKAENEKIKQENIAVQSKIDDLKTKNPDDPEIKKLEAQVANNKNTITDNEVKTEVTLATALMTRAVSQAGANLAQIQAGYVAEKNKFLYSNDQRYRNEFKDQLRPKITKLIETARGNINEARGNRTAAVINKNPLEIKVINDQANYSEYVLEFMKINSLIAVTTAPYKAVGVYWSGLADEKEIHTADLKAQYTAELNQLGAKIDDVQDVALNAELKKRLTETRGLVEKKFTIK